jgi:hypothetical protein
MVFNSYTLPADTAAGYYADDQVIQLDAGSEFPRSERQLRAIRELRPAPPVARGSVFGESLEWAYREYIVHRLLKSHDADMPLGTRPPQPISAAARKEQLAALQVVERPPEPGDLRLCLFNVLAATEWYPTPATLDMLAWAFRRASDFLYDATDGRMAFGQVTVGGPELLAAADIQIMASNRLNPRTWVSGLHNELKYMAIRLGRAAWHKNNRVSIPWDEPEAYRTLVHEWSHYALELPDEYLEAHHVFLPSAVNSASASADRLERGPYTLVVPGISLATESIMGTLEGTSELVPQYSGSTERRLKNVWRIIREKGRYPFLDAVTDRDPLPGPGALPLPLPAYHTLDAASAPEELRMAVPNTIDAGHCWVYLLRGTTTEPERLIAQGTLDARAPADGFVLLGARVGDTAVLVGSADGALLVLAGTITAAAGGVASIPAWRDATPPSQPPPVVDVLPSPLGTGEPDERIAQISVRVQSSGAPPDMVAVFPHGQRAASEVLQLGAPGSDDWTSAPQSVTSLDGHVLLSWPDGGMLIFTYSQGGGPATHIPPGPPSISAGSSEGNIMLFFQRDELGRDYSTIRAVTTLLHGLPHTLPGGAEARGYGFSIASNAALPVELNPTVVLYFDVDAPQDGGALIVCRQAADGSWQAMPSYQPSGSSFIAMPLRRETGQALVSLQATGPRVERYRLFWAPQAAQSPS